MPVSHFCISPLVPRRYRIRVGSTCLVLENGSLNGEFSSLEVCLQACVGLKYRNRSIRTFGMPVVSSPSTSISSLPRPAQRCFFPLPNVPSPSRLEHFGAQAPALNAVHVLFFSHLSLLPRVFMHLRMHMFCFSTFASPMLSFGFRRPSLPVFGPYFFLSVRLHPSRVFEDSLVRLLV